MEQDVVVTTETQTPGKTRPQQSYLWIVAFQFHSFRAIVKPERLIVMSHYSLFKGVRSNQMIDCCVSIDSAIDGNGLMVDCCVSIDSAIDGNDGRKGKKDKRSKRHPHTNERGAHSPVVYEEGQARSRASDHKHPVTTEETVEGGGKKVKYEDHRNTKGKVSTSTTNFVEGHGGSRATKGERRKPAPGRCRGGWVSSIRTSLIAYQTPSQTEHTWRKSKDNKTSNHISEERSRARIYAEQGNEPRLRTKNKSKRTSVATYHDVDTKSQVRSPERPTSHNKNIVSARPDAFGARGRYEDDGAPNAYSDRTLAHPKCGLSGNNNDVPYGGRHRRYVGNTSQRLDTNYDDEVVTVEMTKE